MKKLMALVLAVATAVSMFATSAFAVDYENEIAYTDAYVPTKVEFVGETIKVTQTIPADLAAELGVDEVMETVIDTGSELKAFVEKIELGEPYGAPYDYAKYVAMNKAHATDAYGAIYMYDYALDKDPASDRTYKTALDKFADLVDEILNTRTQDVAALDVDEFITAWGKAYKAPTVAPDETTVRWNAVTEAKANKRAVRDYFDASGDLIADYFEAEDLEDYNAAELLKDVYAFENGAGMATSAIIYLNSEYERIIEEIGFAEATDVQDYYYELLDKVTSYVEEDFTAAGWREVQELLAEAEEVADEAVSKYDWKEATLILEDATKVRGKAVDYTELQEALMELFVPVSSKAKASDIRPAGGIYVGDDADVYVYEAENFIVRGKASNEWLDFAGDEDGMVDDEPAAFTEAYEIYKKVRGTATAYKQSEVDEAVENLIDAVDALVSNADDVAEWLLVKLQTAVDTAEALVESDYNTTSRKWENFQEDIAKAKAVLEKANPTETEVVRVTNVLAKEEGVGSLYDIMTSAKSTSGAKEKELKELMRKADRLINNITTQTGAQVAALRKAADAAYDVENNLTPEKDWEVTTISQLDAAIADLTAAIDNFNNPQGWYKEDGKWYYGVGAEVYADGWAQIGETWFMFNADGSLKMSEWFQVEGKWYWANENGGLAVGWAKVDGKWYFFDQGNAMKTGWVKADNNWYYLASSGAMVTGWNWIGGNCYYFYNNGAMAANTTIGGYTVDANGAWVK